MRPSTTAVAARSATAMPAASRSSSPVGDACGSNSSSITWSPRRSAARRFKRRADQHQSGSRLEESAKHRGRQTPAETRGSSGREGEADRAPARRADRRPASGADVAPVSYTHLRAHETPEHLVCRLLLAKPTRLLSISYAVFCLPKKKDSPAKQIPTY